MTHFQTCRDAFQDHCLLQSIWGFLFIYLFYLFIFGCIGSSLLCAGFLQLRQAGATLHCSVRASHCSGFSCCGAQALGTWASVVVARGLENAGSVVVVHGLLIAVASLVAEHRLQAHGLQQLWLGGSRAQAQQLWCMGLAVPRHVGSSWTRAQTCVPCTGSQILNHCTTREAPGFLFKLNLFLSPILASFSYAQDLRPTTVHDFAPKTLKVVMQYNTTQSVVHGPRPVQNHLLPACDKYQN